MWFDKHKIEQKYVWIRLEMLSSTQILVKSVKINIFHVNNRRARYVYPRVGEWVIRRGNVFPMVTQLQCGFVVRVTVWKLSFIILWFNIYPCESYRLSPPAAFVKNNGLTYWNISAWCYIIDANTNWCLNCNCHIVKPLLKLDCGREITYHIKPLA